jgi:transposase
MGGQWQKEMRQFGTMTKELLALLDWLVGEGCTHVAMESTGVYWKPVYNILEGQLELLVVNAQHLKAVPGRKTDVRDAEWIAELLAHGLLRGSFVPPVSVREVRELTRYRTSVVRDCARTINRLQKVLEGANIKLASVVSDIRGVSARLMLEGLLAGERDTEQLASLAKGRLKEKREQLVEALSGRLQPHQSFLIAEHLAQIDYLEGAIERLSHEIEERLRPFEQQIGWLDTIPGVNRRTAEVLWAETGGDMSRFPSARHLASWAGMCPGNNESAGKRRTGRTRKGSPWLRHCLVEAAHGAAHTRNKYLSSQYHRLIARRGKKKALVAVGHSILVIAYHLLTRQQAYSDLGANYFDERDRQAVTNRCLNRLQKLGYKVTLEKMSLAA